MMLRATWSVKDAAGDLVAHGVHHFDVDNVGSAKADPYEPALAIANSFETALHAYLGTKAARIVTHDADHAVAISVARQ
jgi:hypothetical protein